MSKYQERGYDNIFSESVYDVTLKNYNKGLADRLRQNEMIMFSKQGQKEGEMLGGVRLASNPMYGVSDSSPSSLAVGGGAYRSFTGDESELEGGKVNRIKKFNRWTDAISKLVPKKVRTALSEGAVRAIQEGGKVNRVKKFNRWTDAISKLVPKKVRTALSEGAKKED